MRNKKTSSPILVNIAAMGPHFLYLPLLFAINRNFFRYLPAGYVVKTHFSSMIRTDLDVFEYVLAQGKPENEIRFGIADPMFVYHKSAAFLGAGKKPAILASILNNSGFWAVDTKKRNILHLQDLADTFDTILCYGPDTTSHRVASHISNLARGKKITLETIASNMELGEYRNRILTGEAAPDTFVLSPDILGIESLIRQDSRVRIELPIAAVTEYTGDIVSALIGSESAVIDSSNTDLIEGMLAGIQASLQMVLAKHEDVVAFAQSYFSDATYAASAIDAGIDHGVFASSVEISRTKWDRTTENSISYFDSARLSRKEIYEKSSGAYDALVAPSRRFWQRAMTRVSQPIFEQLAERPQSYGFLHPMDSFTLLAFVPLALLGASQKYGDHNGIFKEVAVEALVSLIIGFLIDRLFAKKHKYHCGVTAIISFIVLFICFNIIGDGSFNGGSISFGIFLAVLALVVTLSKKARTWVWPHL